VCDGPRETLSTIIIGFHRSSMLVLSPLYARCSSAYFLTHWPWDQTIAEYGHHCTTLSPPGLFSWSSLSLSAVQPSSLGCDSRCSVYYRPTLSHTDCSIRLSSGSEILFPTAAQLPYQSGGFVLGSLSIFGCIPKLPALPRSHLAATFVGGIGG
jgi:hypothetical protein